MHIITTIYFAETRRLIDKARVDRQLEVSDLKDSDRQWVSIYEGKNRVEPIDQND
ncbi:hypothetical protein P8935_19875 [Telmatobacter sp. DSM 110680]|uniref:Uncharacterized protein n=1 Tax=Telmatobacter sp. DSM 110680 TaxID=3036704 RepID=A0AAU7DFP4_9BACT